MTYLICDGKIIKSGIYELVNGINGKNREFCFTNKRPKSRGKWYYEIKHIYGTAKKFLAAWKAEKGYFGFYPDYVESNPYAYSWSSAQTISYLMDGQKIKVIPLNLEDFLIDETVGIGLDIDNKTFYIRTGINIRSYQLVTNETHFQPYMLEAYSTTEEWRDTVKVTFDPKFFRYSIPEGFSPWGYYLRYTCIQRKNTNTVPKCLAIIILIIS